jgi:hypothetical protein
VTCPPLGVSLPLPLRATEIPQYLIEHLPLLRRIGTLSELPGPLLKRITREPSR